MSGDGITISLMCCTQVIQQDIEHGRQKDVALTYAMAIRSEARGHDKPDWKVINTAIINRWGMIGLKRVKNRAWKLVEGKIQL